MRSHSGPEACLPLRGEVLVLRQDVLDGVLVHRHALLAVVVLQPAQPVAAAAEVVEVRGLQLALELLVGREAAIGRQHQEVRLDALQIAVLLERRAEGREGLVHRVGGDGADGAAEHVALDQPHRVRRSSALRERVCAHSRDTAPAGTG